MPPGAGRGDLGSRDTTNGCSTSSSRGARCRWAGMGALGSRRGRRPRAGSLVLVSLPRGDALSPVGRTRTLPAADATPRPPALRLRLVPALRAGLLHRLPAHGRRGSRRRLSPGRLHLRGHRPRWTSAASIVGPELVTLEDYRNRYAQYKTDPRPAGGARLVPLDRDVGRPRGGQQLCGRRFPNGTVRRTVVPRPPRGRVSGLLRAHAAAPPFDAARAGLRLYRGFAFGQLASFFVLDTRQYRTDQPCGDDTTWSCGAEARSERDDDGRGAGAVAAGRLRPIPGAVERPPAAGDDRQGRPAPERPRPLLHGSVAGRTRSSAGGCSPVSARARRQTRCC